MTNLVLQQIVGAAVLAAVVALAGAVFRPSPAVRHALWLLVLIKLLVPPVVQWPWALPEFAFQSGTSDLESAAPYEAEPLPRDPATPVVRTERTMPMPSTPTPAEAQRRYVLSRFGDPYVIGTAIWLAGTILLALIQCVRAARFWNSQRGLCEAPDWMVLEVARMADRFGMAPPSVSVSEAATAPAVIHLSRVRLIVPRQLVEALDRQRWSCVLAHELAHLKRRDHVVRWLELIAGCIWWWNPVFWITRRKLRANAELACDAWVVWALPEGRRAYAETLVDVSELIVKRNLPIAALGMGAGARLDFERRLAMILHGTINRKLSRAAAVATAIVCLISLPGLSLYAQPAGPDSPESPSEATGSAPESSPGQSAATPPLVEPVEPQQDDSSDRTASSSEYAENLRKALDAPVSIEFDDTHISTVAQFISEYVGINFVIDYRAVMPEGLNPDGELAKQYVCDGYVTRIKLNDVALKNGLVALLEPLNLTYAPRNGFIFISSAERIASEAFPPVPPGEGEIARALDAPVNIEFDDEHITRILDFIAEYTGVNIVVDQRAVMSAPKSPPPGVPVSAGAPNAAALPGGLSGLSPGASETGEASSGLAGIPGSPPAVPVQAAPVQHRVNVDEQYVLTGIVPYIRLTDIPLSDALKGLLVPLDLYYSVREGYIFVSSPKLLAQGQTKF